MPSHVSQLPQPTSPAAPRTFPFALRTTAGYTYASDPSVTLHPTDHGFYAAAVGFNDDLTTYLRGSNALFVVASPDGITWSAPLIVTSGVASQTAAYSFADRPWLVYGPNGRLWALWRQFNCNSPQGMGACIDGGVMMRSSTNSGLTWTTSVRVSSGSILSVEWSPGNFVALPDGTIRAAYFAIDRFNPITTTYDFSMHITRCTPTACADLTTLSIVTGAAPLLLGDHLDGLPGTRLNSFPYLARRPDGTLLLVWMGAGAGAAFFTATTHVFAAASTNGGTTWSSFTRVDPAPGNQFLPFPAWGGTGQNAPFPQVCYYRQVATSNLVDFYCNTWLQTSCGGWCTPFRVTSASISVPTGPDPKGWLGDYTAFDGYNLAFANYAGAASFISTSTYNVYVASGCQMMEGGSHDPFVLVSLLAALAVLGVRRRRRLGYR